MCVAFWLWQPDPQPAAGDGPPPVRYALLLALNRDEVLSRPSQAAHFWADDPGIFAGRDLVQGGTWLGVSKSGRVGWLTNVRETYVDAAAHTRGDLVTAFLQGRESPLEYCAAHAPHLGAYNGFNLVVADLRIGQMAYCTNRPPGQSGRIEALPSGMYGLSNAALDTPWPKVVRGKATFASLVAATADAAVPAEELVHGLLQDRWRPPGDQLPHTGRPPEVEAELSPIFVECTLPELGAYGTRSQTVIGIQHNGHVDFFERYLDNDGTWKEQQQMFEVECQRGNGSEQGLKAKGSWVR
ncbi:hypothetical protein KFL_000970330 [Klebsormidium nitens]|uniref:Transport and Golgi organization protein n=1 Tax=Klebsormidium nitens TaxID=105231 RepID=A0A0U9HJD5_KLENI|nr:hypothetical protein KFL_000970330 [Klebsormidium nitens]|eukprot:GAQ82007.1 hypothetical protein KFL_000970330 [Klebsormidium nitens]